MIFLEKRDKKKGKTNIKYILLPIALSPSCVSRKLTKFVDTYTHVYSVENGHKTISKRAWNGFLLFIVLLYISIDEKIRIYVHIYRGAKKNETNFSRD